MFGLNLDPSVEQRDVAFELATLADAAGLDVVTCQDHPYHRRHLDMWTLLTAVAATTSRVAVMPTVANLPLRTPPMVAKAAATLAILSDGRVELGVGAGARFDAIAAYGGPQRSAADAVDAFEEGVAVVKGLLDPDRDAVSLAGTYHDLDGAKPGPLPERPLRLWFGAYGDRMLGLTGAHADGWTPTNRYAPPARVPSMQARIDAAAEAASRDPADVRRGYNVMGRIDPDADVEDGEQVAGPVAHWVDTLARYREELGLDAFVFWPLGGDELEQARRFAHEVVPEVRERFGDGELPRGGYL